MHDKLRLNAVSASERYGSLSHLLHLFLQVPDAALAAVGPDQLAEGVVGQHQLLARHPAVTPCLGHQVLLQEQPPSALVYYSRRGIEHGPSVHLSAVPRPSVFGPLPVLPSIRLSMLTFADPPICPSVRPFYCPNNVRPSMRVTAITMPSVRLSVRP